MRLNFPMRRVSTDVYRRNRQLPYIGLVNGPDRNGPIRSLILPSIYETRASLLLISQRMTGGPARQTLFVFTNSVGQLGRIYRGLGEIAVFQRSICSSHSILSKFGLDLTDILDDNYRRRNSSLFDSYISSVAVQVRISIASVINIVHQPRYLYLSKYLRPPHRRTLIVNSYPTRVRIHLPTYLPTHLHTYFARTYLYPLVKFHLLSRRLDAGDIHIGIGSYR